MFYQQQMYRRKSAANWRKPIPRPLTWKGSEVRSLYRPPSQQPPKRVRGFHLFCHSFATWMLPLAGGTAAWRASGAGKTSVEGYLHTQVMQRYPSSHYDCPLCSRNRTPFDDMDKSLSPRSRHGHVAYSI